MLPFSPIGERQGDNFGGEKKKMIKELIEKIKGKL